MPRFEPKALYRAIDAQRAVRGLTWAQVAAEIGVSAATITRTRDGGRMEVDGMLAMTRWLDVPAETFVGAPRRPVISVMLAVADAARAVAWYERALGATQLWNLGSVVGLSVHGATFFVGEPENNGWETPTKLGLPSVRIEVFCDDPDAFIARALEAGATAGRHTIAVHDMPWGPHRQGGFTDPFGHVWFVGDRSPLARHRP